MNQEKVMMAVQIITCILMISSGMSLISIANKDEADHQCSSKSWIRVIGILLIIWYIVVLFGTLFAFSKQ